MEKLTFSLECEASEAEAFAARLSEVAQCEVTSARKNSLDGSPETVLQIIQVGVPLAATITSLVATYVANKRVKKIKVGEIEIENPTREQWERLWDDYLSNRTKSRGKSKRAH